MELHNALALAEHIHQGTAKSGTDYPFLYHPLAVASLVLKYGGSLAQAQAALLHDTIVDPQISEERLTREFGPEVARLAFAFADPPPSANTGGAKALEVWQRTRESYLVKLAT